MAYQTAKNVLVAVLREATVGTIPATVTGGSQVRIIDGSPGLNLGQADIRSAELRADAFTNMGRLGFKTVDGNFQTELTAGGATNLFLESIMRSAFATATAIDYATMTTVAVGTNALTAAGGDFTTLVKVGDVFTLSGTGTTSNENKRTMITALGSLTITVATGTFVTQAAAATGTITVLRRLVAAATPTRTSYVIEQVDKDIDASEVFSGCRLIQAQLSFRPGEMVKATWTFMGLDRTTKTASDSPFLTSPSVTTTLPLVADDSTIRYNGATIATLTGFDLNFQITAAGQPVIGSLTSVDVFDNTCAISGQITGLRSDFSNFTLYSGETEFEIGIVLKEPTGTPPECIGLFFPRVKIKKITAPVGGGDGAKIETMDIEIAPKAAATGYDAGPAVITTSSV